VIEFDGNNNGLQILIMDISSIEAQHFKRMKRDYMIFKSRSIIFKNVS
jgi:hypothetical protein